MSNLAEMAKSFATKNPILNGREKIDSDKVVELFGKGFTPKEVARVDITDRKTGEPKHYYYIAVREDDTVIISSGQVLTNVLDQLITNCGDIAALNAALTSDDSLLLIPRIKKSQNGNRYLDIEFGENK